MLFIAFGVVWLVLEGVIVCFCFVWVWWDKNATLHLWLWNCLLFWFGLVFVGCLVVGCFVLFTSLHCGMLGFCWVV